MHPPCLVLQLTALLGHTFPTEEGGVLVISTPKALRTPLSGEGGLVPASKLIRFDCKHSSILMYELS